LRGAALKRDQCAVRSRVSDDGVARVRVVHADEAGWDKVNQSMSFGLHCVATQISAEGMLAIHRLNFSMEVAESKLGWLLENSELRR
jgi:hypothetical protein